MRAIWAVVLGIIVPGSGQIFAGDWLLGVAINAGYLACGALVLIAFSILPLTRVTAIAYLLSLAALVVLQLAIAVDAARRTWRRPEGVPRPWYKRTWIAVPVSITVAFFVMPLGLRRYEAFHIPSASNAPTIQVGDIIVVDKGITAARDVDGDLVAFRVGPRNETWLKRVVGIAGDTVQIQSGQLYIDGKQVARESAGTEAAAADGMVRYHETLPGGTTHDIFKASDGVLFDAVRGVDINNTAVQTVPPGMVFVLGDSRDDSLDSRFPAIGFVPVDRIQGVARVVVWSPDHRRILTDIK